VLTSAAGARIDCFNRASRGKSDFSILHIPVNQVRAFDVHPVMALICRRCERVGIDHEAHTAGLGGGFVCNRCYWTLRLWTAAVGIPVGCLVVHVSACSELAAIAIGTAFAGIYVVLQVLAPKQQIDRPAAHEATESSVPAGSPHTVNDV